MEHSNTANTENVEDSLTLKKLQSHLVKTVLGALAVGIVGAFITSYVSSYTTTNSINELNDSKVETRQDIKELKNDVSDIKTTLSNTTIYTNANQGEINTLKQDVKEIRKSQDEMLKLLYEIKSKQ